MADPQKVELNGKIYDAITGRHLGNTEQKPIVESVSKPLSIDGFLGNYKPNIRYLTPHKIAPNTKRSTDKSKTLMRHAVKQPAKVNKITHDILRKKVHHISRNKISNDKRELPIHQEILSRVQRIPKSQFVAKFNDPVAKVLTVSQAPAKLHDDIHTKNISNLEDLDKKANKPISQLDELTRIALEKADAHKLLEANYKDAPIKNNHRKGFFLIALVIVIIAIGFTGYLMFNNFLFLVDSTRIGLHSRLPTFTESGFHLGKISQNGDGVTLLYSSNSDGRTYKLIESPTNWDSQTLVINVVNANVGSSYNTIQVDGRVVYLFNNEAVWVDGNVFYTLINNAHLTSNQLSQVIAGS